MSNMGRSGKNLFKTLEWQFRKFECDKEIVCCNEIYRYFYRRKLTDIQRELVKC